MKAKKRKVRKPKPLKFRYETTAQDNEQAYECGSSEGPRATVINTFHMQAWEARRLAKWLNQFADWAESRNGRKP